jgi:chromate transporter
MMESEIVRRRRWITPARFLDLFGAASLIPGPSSSELAIFIGYEQAGLVGLLVAGTCFILPAATVSGLLGWAYVRFGKLPETAGILYGVKPVIIAVIAQAVMSLAPRAVKSRTLGLLGVAALGASAIGLDPILVLLIAGIVGAVAVRVPHRTGMLMVGAVAGLSSSFVRVTLWGIFLFFLKTGAVVFGSGYVLLAFLRSDLVDRWHWLTESQLLDAVAVGQVTPGPVFSTATFIGYLLAGVPGAAVATIGIFLPGFLLVALSRPLLARVRKSPTAGAFLDGVNVASLGLMAWVTVELARTALVDVPTVLVGLVGAIVILRWKVNTAWLVGAGALVGLVLQSWR